MAKIGVSNFYYALVTADAAGGLTYSAPVAVPGLTQLDIKTASDTATLYADNGPYETASALGEITVDIDLADLDLATQAALLGHSLSGGVMVLNANDVAPNVAIGFKGLKGNGKYRYVWLLKGTFAEPDDTYKSKGEKVEYQTQKITGKFVITAYDGNWKRIADEDAAGYSATVGTNWFTSPLGSGDTTPPTVTCVPADGASGVGATDNIVLTFSEEMDISSLVIGESFVLQKADGTDIAGAGAWTTGNTVYTFNPAPSLSGAHNIIITKAVKDLAGNKLAAVNVFNFTV